LYGRNVINSGAGEECKERWTGVLAGLWKIMVYRASWRYKGSTLVYQLWHGLFSV